MSEMAEAIRELMEEKGLSEEAVKISLENTLKAAYKKVHGTCDNAVVVFEDDLSDVKIFSRKEVVDGVYDPVTEIELEEALELAPGCEVGDELDIPEDPKTWSRAAVTNGMNNARQGFNENYRTSLVNEYKDKVGGMIIGYYQHEKNGNIFVDLGGRVEGILPAKLQSPREKYEKGDRIRAYVVDIKNQKTGVQLVLSRSDPELVRLILETEVTEIGDKIVEVNKIVREAGYRTKIAVSSNREDVDPVGACVGLKGTRITNVIHELLGEKIDVLKYDPDPAIFIKNALSPAEVTRVVILDQDKKQALAIVPESQFSLAIGKQGQNVRLANKLCDWTIDVKTEEQADEMNLKDIVSRQNAQNLFNDTESDANLVKDLPGVDERIAELLKAGGIEDVQQFVDAYENGSIKTIQGLTEEEIEKVNKIIDENIEFVDDEEAGEAEGTEMTSEDQNGQEEDEYFCPECGAKITLDMTHCPKCGVEFEFKTEEE